MNVQSGSVSVTPKFISDSPEASFSPFGKKKNSQYSYLGMTFDCKSVFVFVGDIGDFNSVNVFSTVKSLHC